MRILITNDDGIYASELIPLVKWAMKLGEVTVAAPKVEQSGKSHGIEIHKSFSLEQVDLVDGVASYALDSTPADCVRYAILGRKDKYDLVISGINRGLNVGADIMYSGTVGAICEAANLGVHALAFSTTPAYYDKAVEHLDMAYDFVQAHKLLEKNLLVETQLHPDILALLDRDLLPKNQAVQYARLPEDLQKTIAENLSAAYEMGTAEKVADRYVEMLKELYPNR